MMRFGLMAVALSLWAGVAMAAPYEVDVKASEIGFSGTHTGMPFTGKFEGWKVSINFDEAAPAKSLFTAEFDLTKAKTGNAMYDGTLPTADWFDVAKFPKATFSSKSVIKAADGGYDVTGDLTLKGVSKPVSLTFNLSDPAVQPVVATGKLTIDRLAFGVGAKADPKAEYVGREIPVTFKIVAAKK